jgi:8-oxo-dGTP pyrophosphatase MutT (NUDIX family)
VTGALGGPAELDERIGALLARHATDSPPAESAGAAVLILLRPSPGAEDLETLLIERTLRDDDPAAGQVSLPGGHVDPQDSSLGATALRETFEEVGIDSSHLLGEPRYVTTERAQMFGLSVGVFAAAVEPRTARPHVRSPKEVASVFWLPRGSLHRSEPVLRSTRAGLMTVEATVHDGHVLWGFTRRILLEFFGFERPSSS